MSARKVERFVGDEINSILRETGEYKSFALGYSYGCYSFYKNILNEFGEEKAKQLFNSFINGNDKYCEYFKKFIEMDEEPDTKADIIFKKMRNLM